MDANFPTADHPDLSAVIMRRGLDEHEAALLTRFARDGYVVFDLDLPDFESTAAEIIRDLKPAHDVSSRLQDAWKNNANVRKLACLGQVTKTLALLYGRDAFPFQTLNFSHGTEQSTHSDTMHFHSFPNRFMAGVWIALEPADENNGPLEYFPGSHKLPCYSLADAGVRGSDTLSGNYSLYSSVYEPFIRDVIAANGLKKTEAHLRTGQALIWAANLLHGGGPIRQPGRTRHSQVTHYYFEDCTYYTPMHSDPMIGKICLREPINIVTGQPVRSRYCGQTLTPQLPNLLSRAKNRLRRTANFR